MPASIPKLRFRFFADPDTQGGKRPPSREAITAPRENALNDEPASRRSLELEPDVTRE